MRYLAALDHDHLDNGVFLTSLARSLSRQQESGQLRPVIVHTDSAYTDRIIQTGVVRREAAARSLKDLNKRLVALFADQGVSTIGINPYKRNFITLNEGELVLDHAFLESLPRQTVLLLSTLVQDPARNRQAVIELPHMLRFLQEEIRPDELFIFSKSDGAEVFTYTDLPESMQWKTMDKSFQKNQIPDDLKAFNRRVRLTTARDFHRIPDLKQTILIN